jgi:hypothetical protein
MRNILIGMILVFLNFDITIGSSKIGLIPSFIGYAYMYSGVMELSDYSNKFVKIAPIIKVMVVCTGLIYLADLLGLSAYLQLPGVMISDIGVPSGFILFGILLGLIVMIASLYISYEIIQGIKDIENVQMKDLNSDQLLSTWKLLAVLAFLSHALLIIVPGLAFICIILTMAMHIYYLFVFNKSKNLYYENDENAFQED